MTKKEKIKKLKAILIKNPSNKKALELIGLLLIDENRFAEGISYLEKVLSIGTNNELDYLGLYIAYVETERFADAIKILNEYLEKNPAKLFIGTLEELVEDLKKGYATTYKDTIINLAKKNNIPIPDDLLE